MGHHISVPTHITGILEEEEKGKGEEKIFEGLIAENSQNLIKDINLYSREAQ